MTELFPVDLPTLFLNTIKESERAPDGLLHPSGDLVGSLRHAQLRAAGAPTKTRPIAQSIRLMHGTIWHDWFHAILEKNKINFQYEVNLTPYMPEGWSGTADWLFWHPEYDAWVLGDLKTTKGESMFFLQRDGAKKEHIWQLSAYYWAAVASGRPMVNAVGVMYWPMNDTNDGLEITPVMHEVAPIPEDEILAVMESRWDATKTYISETLHHHSFLTPSLAPEQEREQNIRWNAKQSVFDVKLEPHWSTRFCDFDVELCPCSLQGSTKIGHWTLDEEYIPREGYADENEGTIVRPSASDFKRRRDTA